MKLYLSQNHSDEEGGFVKQGKLGVLIGQKSDIHKLSEFLNQVVKHLDENDTCHMHFRDSFQEWNKEGFIDLEINVEQSNQIIRNFISMEIKLVKGDITKIKTEAIVNAANTSLLGGGGVDGAIHRAGGEQILKECIEIRNRQGGCKVGEAVITNGGKLPAKKVIHTVGPRWNNNKSNEEEKLKNCYINCLKIAEANNLKSIAFPNISTGIYRFPKDTAAEIAITTINEFESNIVEEVIFVCFDDENYSLYSAKLNSK